jgi:hypothetical protein
MGWYVVLVAFLTRGYIMRRCGYLLELTGSCLPIPPSSSLPWHLQQRPLQDWGKNGYVPHGLSTVDASIDLGKLLSVCFATVSMTFLTTAYVLIDCQTFADSA